MRKRQRRVRNRPMLRGLTRCEFHHHRFVNIFLRSLNDYDSFRHNALPLERAFILNSCSTHNRSYGTIEHSAHTPSDSMLLSNFQKHVPERHFMGSTSRIIFSTFRRNAWCNTKREKPCSHLSPQQFVPYFPPGDQMDIVFL